MILLVKTSKGALKATHYYDYSYFHKVFLKPLIKIAPIKKKTLRFNKNPFISKALRETIIQTSKLKNIYKKCRTEGN